MNLAIFSLFYSSSSRKVLLENLKIDLIKIVQPIRKIHDAIENFYTNKIFLIKKAQIVVKASLTQNSTNDYNIIIF